MKAAQVSLADYAKDAGPVQAFCEKRGLTEHAVLAIDLANETFDLVRAPTLEVDIEAVSRAYCAVNVAAQLMAGMGCPLPRGPAGHGEAQHRLVHNKDEDLEALANQLGALHSRRIEADYRLERKDLEDEVTAIGLVSRASSMVVILDACRRDPARLERVKAGIVAYLAGPESNGA